ncbi:MAG: hypothetical protein L6R41_002894, partial [Letrouitia leprolyta]
MPHKHKRLKTSSVPTHDLPPTFLARPLPVSKSPLPSKPIRRKHENLQNDTPRAFTRLMTYASTGQKTLKGLDDGLSTTKFKKRKRDPDAEAPPEVGAQPPFKPTEIPKILPGERMGDYSARVDQALPVAGLVNKGKRKGVAGEKQPQSKLEKKMQRMQKEWRAEEVRRKANLEEQREEEEEEDGVEFDDSYGKSKKK